MITTLALTPTHRRDKACLVSTKSFLAILLFALCASFLQAEEENKQLFSKPVTTDEAWQQFKKIAEKLQENKIVRAEFKQSKTIKTLKRPLLSEGNFLIATSKGLYFETTKPFEQLTVITADYLIQKDSGGNVSKIKSDAHPLLQKSTESFLSIFSGKTESLKEQYQIYLLEEGENWQIGLMPKDKNESKEYIGRIIFKGNKHLNTLYMEEKSGNYTTIEFANHRTDQGELSSDEQKKFEPLTPEKSEKNK